jgi:hypothetical protein
MSLRHLAAFLLSLPAGAVIGLAFAYGTRGGSFGLLNGWNFGGQMSLLWRVAFVAGCVMAIWRLLYSN